MRDASTLSDLTFPYYAALADRSARLGASGYTLHAGYRDGCTLPQMIDNVRRLQDVFPCAVGVEGLYPRPDHPQLMDSWADYEAVLRAGLPLAVDLSHLNIVAFVHGRHDDLVRELLASKQTIEVHLSANDGRRDSHSQLREPPWWWAMRHHIHPSAVVFSEGSQRDTSQSTPRRTPCHMLP